MKTFLFVLMTIGLCFSASAQSKGKIKLYGFQQSVSGGKAPEPDENGLRRSKRGGKNYFLYAVSPSRIYPVELWVEGTRYGADMRVIDKTPVEWGNELDAGSTKKLLIPKTSQKVVQLSPSATIESKSVGTKAKSLAAKNDLVVVYKQGGKFYYQTLARLSNLEDASMQ